MAECMLDLGRTADAQDLFAQATAIHASHAELAERYREPLRHLRARMPADPKPAHFVGTHCCKCNSLAC